MPVDHATVVRGVLRDGPAREKRSAVARRTDHPRGVLRSPRDRWRRPATRTPSGAPLPRRIEEPPLGAWTPPPIGRRSSALARLRRADQWYGRRSHGDDEPRPRAVISHERVVCLPARRTRPVGLPGRPPSQPLPPAENLWMTIPLGNSSKWSFVGGRTGRCSGRARPQVRSSVGAWETCGEGRRRSVRGPVTPAAAARRSGRGSMRISVGP